MCRILPLPFVFLLSVLILSAFFSGPFWASAASPPTKELPLHTTKNNFFTIPFEIKVDEHVEYPAEVELTYSTDKGMQWFPYERVTPDKKQFLFKAQSDGEHWFIFNTYGKDGQIKQTKRRSPMLRVLVDTIPPKLTVKPEQKSTGELFIQWSTEDANLTRVYPRIQIMYSIPDQKTYLSNWKPIAIDPASIHSEGNRHWGDLMIWPDRNATAVEIQAEMYDSAGNREIMNQTVTLTVNESSQNANVLTESMQTAFQGLHDPRDRQQSRTGLASSKVRTAFTASPEESKTSGKKMSTISLTPPRPLILNATQESQNIKDSKKTKDVSNPQSSSASLRPLPLAEINKSLKTFAAQESPQEQPRNSLQDSFDNLQFPLLPKIASNAGSQNFESPQSQDSNENASVVPGPILFSELSDAGSSANKESRQSWEQENSLDDTFDPFGLPDLFADNIDSSPTFATLNPRIGDDPICQSLHAAQGSDMSKSDTPVDTHIHTHTHETEPLTVNVAKVDTSDYENSVKNADPAVDSNHFADLEQTDKAAAWQQIVRSQNMPESPAEELVNPILTMVQISKVSHLRGLDSSQILLNWETRGPNDNWIHSENAKIHIYYGSSQRGPWIPIAMNLKNTGSHTWNVNEAFRNPFFILVQVEGEARELVSDLTRTPIQLPPTAFSR